MPSCLPSGWCWSSVIQSCCLWHWRGMCPWVWATFSVFQSAKNVPLYPYVMCNAHLLVVKQNREKLYFYGPHRETRDSFFGWLQMKTFSMGSRRGLDFMLTQGCFSMWFTPKKAQISWFSIQTWHRYTAMIYVTCILSISLVACHQNAAWFSLGVLGDGGQGLLLLCSFWVSLSFWSLDLFVNLTLGPERTTRLFFYARRSLDSRRWWRVQNGVKVSMNVTTCCLIQLWSLMIGATISFTPTVMGRTLLWSFRQH